MRFCFSLALLLSVSRLTSAESRQSMWQRVVLLDNICLASSDTQPASVIPAFASRSLIECAARCDKVQGCLACGQEAYDRRIRLVMNSTVSAALDNCKVISTMDRIEILVTTLCLPKLKEAVFLVAVNSSGVSSSLAELLCSRWCGQLASDGSQFATLGAVARAAGSGSSVLCTPLSASAYFASAIASGGSSAIDFSPIAVSLNWRLLFTNESWCTHTAVGNVPPLLHLAWSQPLQLDVCAQACVWRPTCEFFVFNASGCFEGSLSLYLNSRLQGFTGCSIWHKARTWASSMLAFYTFNSSMLNLANPAIMPAVNNSPIDIGPDGFQVPLSTSQFVRLNLSHIGFDLLVRSDKPVSFVLLFTRTSLKARSELLLFASCSGPTVYNGAINEQSSSGNVAWFVNTLTGNWQEADSVLAGSTYSYPSSAPISYVVSMNSTTGYYIVNGKLVTTSFKKYHSTYGSDPAAIGCLYLGFNPFYIDSILNGRIKQLGVFSRMLSVSEAQELF